MDMSFRQQQWKQKITSCGCVRKLICIILTFDFQQEIKKHRYNNYDCDHVCATNAEPILAFFVNFSLINSNCLVLQTDLERNKNYSVKNSETLKENKTIRNIINIFYRSISCWFSICMVPVQNKNTTEYRYLRIIYKIVFYLQASKCNGKWENCRWMRKKYVDEWRTFLTSGESCWWMTKFEERNQ